MNGNQGGTLELSCILNLQLVGKLSWQMYIIPHEKMKPNGFGQPLQWEMPGTNDE